MKQTYTNVFFLLFLILIVSKLIELYGAECATLATGVVRRMRHICGIKHHHYHQNAPNLTTNTFVALFKKYATAGIYEKKIEIVAQDAPLIARVPDDTKCRIEWAKQQNECVGL